MSEIRDPIFGYIHPTETEFAIINTKVFQRLRRIRQLAMEYLVYPSAVHSRFEHSLGVFYIAGRIADQLLPGSQNSDKRNLIRWSALLHDIGHGPFSHTSEEIFERYSTIPDPTAKEKIHETITFRLIQNDPELKRCLSQNNVEDIIGLLKGDKVDSTFMKQIVSGPIDADKMDYLLRDSHFCGVKYGIFDFERMLNTLTVINDEANPFDSQLGIEKDGVNMLEQYVLAKYYMITQVYFHKIRRVSDSMIVRGIELGIEKDDNDDLKRIYFFEDSEDYYRNYIAHWDDRLINKLIYTEKNSYAKQMFLRLYDRNLFKRIYYRKIGEIEFPKQSQRDFLININKKENSNAQRNIEGIIAKDVIKCPPEQVILKVTQIKSVREMAKDSEGHILINDTESTRISYFDNESTIFNSINDQLKDIFVEVYAPFEYSDAREKNAKRILFQEQISEVLRTEGRQDEH